MDIIAISFGGIIGALLRYYLILLVTLYFHYPVFYGTFLIGFLASWFQQVDFVWFHSYILDIMNLWRSQQYKVALGYCLNSLILGFFSAELGVFIYQLQ